MVCDARRILPKAAYEQNPHTSGNSDSEAAGIFADLLPVQSDGLFSALVRVGAIAAAPRVASVRPMLFGPSGFPIDNKLSMFVTCCPITGSQQLPEGPRLPGEVPDDA